MKIGVFDSGLGGLSIVKAIREEMPDDDLFYVGDTAFVPWGGRDDKWILRRCSTITRYLVENGAQAIVVACNTATAHAVQQLREIYEIPIFGVEPPVKPAFEAADGRILVLATLRTLQSERFAMLVSRYCQGQAHRLLLRPSPDLVELVESGRHRTPKTASLLQEILSPCIDGQMASVVLGCTHFSWLSPLIHELIGSEAVIHDPAVAVALQVRRKLAGFPGFGNSGSSQLVLQFTSDMTVRRDLLDYLLSGVGYQLQQANIPSDERISA